MSQIRLNACRTTFKWKDLASAGVEMLANIAILNPGGLISPLLRALGNAKSDDSLACRAVKLVVESCILTIIHGMEDFNELSQQTPAQKNDLVSYVSTRCEFVSKGDSSVEREHLRRPSSSPCFDQLVHVVHTYLERIEITVDANVLHSKLSKRFDKCLFELFYSRYSYYEIIEKYLHSAVELQLSHEDIWRQYNIELIKRFEDGDLIGEEGDDRLRLSDVYVPLRAWWEVSNVGLAESSEIVFLRQPMQRNYNYLSNHVEKWLTSFKAKDTIRLISGGPGSGKSTFAKKLAADYALKDDWRTLFLPLQRLREGGALEDRIDEYFRRQFDEPFGDQSPLKDLRSKMKKNWLIIFDGLDELVGDGPTAANVAQAFATALSDWRARVASIVDMRFVVLGRAPSMQDARECLGLLGQGTLYVADMMPILEGYHKHVDDIKVCAIDQRPRFWLRYAAAKKLSSETPKALLNSTLAELSKEPLLAYLLIYSGFADQNWELAAENYNRIYKAIFQKIWDRERSKPTRGYLNDLGKACFDALLQALGLAAWHGSGRTGDEITFERVKKDFLRPHFYNKSKSSEVSTLENIAVLFYTRRDEGQAQGFEFIHKSFGEYHAGVALAQSFLRWIGQLATDEAEISSDQFLLNWARISSYQEINYEVYGFLCREVALLLSEADEPITTARRAAEVCCDCLNTALQVGFRLDKLGAEVPFRYFKNRQKNSTINLLACLNALAQIAYPSTTFLTDHKDAWSYGPLKIPFFLVPSGLRIFIKEYCSIASNKSLRADGSEIYWTAYRGVIQSLLNYIDFSSADISLTMLSGLSFGYCSFEKARFVRASFDNCSFICCDISSATLAEIRGDYLFIRNSMLKATDFSSASVTQVCLFQSNLTDSYFKKARFRTIYIDNSSLPTADLSRMQVRAARLYQIKRKRVLSKFHKDMLDLS